MMMEPVRVLVNEKAKKGMLLNAQLEAAVKVFAEFMELNSVVVCKGFLLKTAIVLGHDCVLIGDRVYPVINSERTFLPAFPIRIVDFAQTVEFGGGQYEGQGQC